MRSIFKQLALSSASFTGVALIAATASMTNGCGSSSSGTTADGGSGDSGSGSDGGGGGDGGASAKLPFQPSNVDLSAIDVSKADADEDLTDPNCIFQTDGTDACFDNHVVHTQVTQSDGTKLAVIIVKSLRLEATAHMKIAGGLPIAIISLGDITLLGTVDAHASGQSAVAGGYTELNAAQKGNGPGGGAAGSAGAAGVGGGGGSYCGLGGLGGQDTAGPTPPAATPAAGSPDVRPMVGGSSGGGGGFGAAGAGGGGVQFVAAGTFTMNSGSYFHVGGGGGGFGGGVGQAAGGGGSGGSILIEATTVTIQSGAILAANGGGGGGSSTGSAEGTDATPNGTQAPGGIGAQAGGLGSGGATDTGGAGTSGDGSGGGGGGAGRIRINTSTGSATTSGVTFSPSSAACNTVGTVRANGTGP